MEKIASCPAPGSMSFSVPYSSFLRIQWSPIAHALGKIPRRYCIGIESCLSLEQENELCFLRGG